MKKKLGVIFLSAVFLIIYVNVHKITALFAPAGVMSAEILSMDEIDSLCEGKKDEMMWPEITWNGAPAAYDVEQNMLLIPQNMEKAEFEGILNVPDGNLYMLEDEGLSDKQEAIRSNTVFRLFWVREEQCWMYNVYFTGMPVAQMYSSDQTSEDVLCSGEFSICDPYRSSRQYQSAACTWHIRGNSSLNYEKSSYKLEFSEEGKKNLSMLGMREDDDWILNSLYTDDGLIHHKLSYEVWKQIAGSNEVSNDEGISMEYLELFMDGEYLGVYGLMERIDKKSLSLTEKDIMYKCRDQVYPGEDDFYTELTEDMSPVFVLKYPKDFTKEDWEPLRTWTELFCTDEPVDYEAGEAVLNMENAIDYNIFTMLICGMDNEMKNIYFVAKYQQDGSWRFVKIPWDLDMTWGNSWIDDPDCFYVRYRDRNITIESGFSSDIYLLYHAKPEVIGKMLNDRWKQLRESIITEENLCKMIEEEYAYLHDSGAYTRNFQKWTAREGYWEDEYIYQYVEGRIHFLDEYMERLAKGE